MEAGFGDTWLLCCSPWAVALGRADTSSFEASCSGRGGGLWEEPDGLPVPLESII